MKEIKVVAMTREERAILDKAIFTLQDMDKALEQISKTDENIKWLEGDCYHALSALEDFIDGYESQFIKPKDEE